MTMQARWGHQPRCSRDRDRCRMERQRRQLGGDRSWRRANYQIYAPLPDFGKHGQRRRRKGNGSEKWESVRTIYRTASAFSGRSQWGGSNPIDYLRSGEADEKEYL